MQRLTQAQTQIRVLCIDPGQTTGYAELADGEIETGNFYKWQMLDSIIVASTQVIVEKPFMTPSVNPVVFEVYGATCERTAHNSSYKLILQAASVPVFITARYGQQMANANIKGTQHQKDALMHLIFYLTREERLDAKWHIQQILDALHTEKG